ncbi:MAG: EsaB/YukD family protein [Lutisporaceae bacterium]
MGKVNVVIVDATGNKEQKVGLPDDIMIGIIMVKLIEKIKLPAVGPDGNQISYKFIHKVTGRQLLETQTLSGAQIKDGDVLRLQPEITAGC